MRAAARRRAGEGRTRRRPAGRADGRTGPGYGAVLRGRAPAQGRQRQPAERCRSTCRRRVPTNIRVPPWFRRRWWGEPVARGGRPARATAGLNGVAPRIVGASAPAVNPGRGNCDPARRSHGGCAAPAVPCVTEEGRCAEGMAGAGFTQSVGVSARSRRAGGRSCCSCRTWSGVRVAGGGEHRVPVRTSGSGTRRRSGSRPAWSRRSRGSGMWHQAPTIRRRRSAATSARGSARAGQAGPTDQRRREACTERRFEVPEGPWHQSLRRALAHQAGTTSADPAPIPILQGGRR